MKEPILSREEVEALAHRICMKYVHSDNEYLRQYTFGMLTLEQFAQAYEAALLEKLCGEPVGYTSSTAISYIKAHPTRVLTWWELKPETAKMISPSTPSRTTNHERRYDR